MIYDNEDEAIQNWLKNNKIKANKVPFSLTGKPGNDGGYIQDNNINSIIKNELFTMPINELALEGKHNIKNAMAATAVAQLLNIRKQTWADFEDKEDLMEQSPDLSEPEQHLKRMLPTFTHSNK